MCAPTFVLITECLGKRLNTTHFCTCEKTCEVLQTFHHHTGRNWHLLLPYQTQNGFWLNFWQFPCGTQLTIYHSISSLRQKKAVSPFSCFSLPSILSCLSQSVELSMKIVSLTACLCFCAYTCHVWYESVYPWWLWHILICLFVFLVVCHLLSQKNVEGYIWGKRPGCWGVMLPIITFLTSYIGLKTKI